VNPGLQPLFVKHEMGEFMCNREALACCAMQRVHSDNLLAIFDERHAGQVTVERGILDGNPHASDDAIHRDWRSSDVELRQYLYGSLASCLLIGHD
jgi:hypothetical protein